MNRREFFKTTILSLLAVPLAKFVPSWKQYIYFDWGENCRRLAEYPDIVFANGERIVVTSIENGVITLERPPSKGNTLAFNYKRYYATVDAVYMEAE